ncbi:MAG: sulfite exporter TauE/SafE family protein [Gemmatimonadota bacterium]
MLCGFTASVVGGLLGIGGGIVLIPMLTAWAGLDQHSAHGTGIVAVAFTALVGVVVYGRGASVDLEAAIGIAVVMLPATILAARHSRRVAADRLRRYFGVFIVIAALILPFRDVVGGGELVLGGGWPAMLAIGLAGGVVSGLLGVGGGSIVVPCLVLVTGFPQQLAQGTSLAVILPSSTAGAAEHARIGHVRRRVLPPVLLGTAAGSYAGGAAALALPGQTLRVIFSVVLLAMGARFIARGATELA